MTRENVTAKSLACILLILVGCGESKEVHSDSSDDPRSREIIALIDQLKDFEWHEFSSPASEDEMIVTPEEYRKAFQEENDGLLPDPSIPFRRNTAEKLYDLGLEAAPFLIQRLDDKTPTRSIAMFHGIELGPRSIGGVCKTILGKLLGAPSDVDVPKDATARSQFIHDFFERRLADKINEQNIPPKPPTVRFQHGQSPAAAR